MIDEIKQLLTKVSKARIAAELCVERTTTIDIWLVRGKVPLKYHVRIQELLGEYFK